MEFVRFIFSSFWIWLGVLILIAVTGNALAQIIREIRGQNGGDDE